MPGTVSPPAVRPPSAAGTVPALLLLADGRFPAGGHAHSAGVEAAVSDGRITDVASLTAFTEGRLRTVGLIEVAFAMATATHLRPGAPNGLWMPEALGQRGPVKRAAVRRGLLGGGEDGVGGDAQDQETVGSSLPPAREGPRPPLEEAAALRVLRALDAELDARTPAPPLRATSRRLGRQLVRVGARCWPSALLDLAVEGGLDPHQSVAFGLVGLAGGLDVEDIGHLVAHHTVTTPMQAGVRLLGLDPFAVAAASAALAGVAADVVAAAGSFATGPIEALPARSATLVDLAAMAHAGADGRLFAT